MYLHNDVSSTLGHKRDSNSQL